MQLQFNPIIHMLYEEDRNHLSEQSLIISHVLDSICSFVLSKKHKLMEKRPTWESNWELDKNMLSGRFYCQVYRTGKYES